VIFDVTTVHSKNTARINNHNSGIRIISVNYFSHTSWSKKNLSSLPYTLYTYTVLTTIYICMYTKFEYFYLRKFPSVTTTQHYLNTQQCKLNLL